MDDVETAPMLSRIAPIAFVSMVLTGCIGAPTHTGSFTSDVPADKLGMDLYYAARKCWLVESGPYKVGVAVENEVDYRGMVITAKRTSYGWPDGDPFMIVTITEEDGRTVVETKEGNSSVLEYSNLSPDVMRWGEGDMTCSR